MHGVVSWRFQLSIANLLIFIDNVGISKLLGSPGVRMILNFLVTKVFRKGTMFKRVCVSLSHEIVCHAVVGKNVLW